PEVTTEELKEKMVLRASFDTSFSTSTANRKHNVKKAAGLLNGTVLKPGEEFSMNGVLGTRTYAAGWKAAPAIVKGGGDTELQAGGGVCQVSTTLYNAVLMADLEITDRRGHSSRVSYVDGGLDATINSTGNIIDFKFKNNTASDILIVSYTKDNRVYTEVYGEPFSGDFDEIRLSSKRIGTVQPVGEGKITVDPTKKPGYEEIVIERKTGTRWQSYKHYYKDGKLVRTENIDVTTYKAHAGEKIVGPEATPTPEPEKPTTKPTKPSKPTPTPSEPMPTPVPEPTPEPPVPTDAPEPVPDPDPPVASDDPPLG
ncbi:MAG: VanW family protein, partial [Christensenellaceae bacterium]|nr:VanW family protein [Christensenellaceae bacterium]